MKGYLLDTDIVVFLLRGKKGIEEKLRHINPSDIYVSDITVAELEYGNRCSGHYETNKIIVDNFLSKINIIPFKTAISLYAKERFRACFIINVKAEVA
ncbi:MAG: PIN domain-containing protein [Muribaculaceae bacterium]